MSKTQSEHAAAAAMIRAELKKLGLTPKVRSSTASMMTAVDVTLVDPHPEILKRVQAIVARHQYGTFDGMTDSYHYDRVDRDLPQVKYATVSAHYGDDLRQKAWAWVRERYGLDDAPEQEAATHSIWLTRHNCWASDLTWQVLGGHIEGFWPELEMPPLTR